MGTSPRVLLAPTTVSSGRGCEHEYSKDAARAQENGPHRERGLRRRGVRRPGITPPRRAPGD
ncbi:MAG TPA: hypothetical protein VLA19_22555, partial [Herpetosiphonaceae bacterium]|nr:hypothetical protein [Herpetosiphonaceae bacterium]